MVGSDVISKNLKDAIAELKANDATAVAVELFETNARNLTKHNPEVGNAYVTQIHRAAAGVFPKLAHDAQIEFLGTAKNIYTRDIETGIIYTTAVETAAKTAKDFPSKSNSAAQLNYLFRFKKYISPKG